MLFTEPLAMTFHLSQTARLLRPSVFSELTPKIKALGERCIPLHIGDTYRLPPEAALSALKKAASEELHSTRFFKYTHPFGQAELLQALVEKLQRDNRIETDTGCIQVTCGATQALCATAQTVLDPGDEVIVLCPHWPLIRGIVQTVGGKVVDASFARSVIDPETTLGPLLTEKTRAIYFANPNNPDGHLLDGPAGKRLYDFAAQHNLYLWSDEAYEHLVYDQQERVSLAQFDNGQAEKRVISIFTFSKSFGMAGLRVGYAVGPEQVISALRRVSTHQIYDLSELNQAAALAALTQPRDQYQAYLKTQVQEYQSARNLLHAALPEADLPPGGAYFFVPFESKEAAWKQMLAWLEAGVSSAPGEAFGGLHPHCLRLCFTAVPYSRLEQAVEVLKRRV